MGTRFAAAAIMAITLALTSLLGGCETQAAPSGPVAHPKTSFKYGTGDGQTMATAVEIRTRSETEGGALVLDWIRANYPGFTIRDQQVIEQRGHAYNVITIIGPSNTTRTLHFDISSYYRRYGNDDFPKPLP
jgi:hypothetical protein